MSSMLIVGLLAGLVAMAVLVVVVMRYGMIRVYRMDAPFETVCANVEKAVRSVKGWGTPIPEWDFHGVVSEKHPFENLKKKKIYFVCKAEYANRIVDKFPKMGGMMPCTWSVYETSAGHVSIAKMNIGLMRWVFTGNVIGRTMGLVAAEEHRMIEELRRLLREERREPGKAAA